MQRNELKDLRFATVRVKQLEYQLEALRVRAERLGGMSVGERVQGGEREELETLMDKIVILQSRITAEVARQLELQCVFQEKCGKLPTQFAVLLNYRFIDCYSIAKIARLMQYSPRQAERLMRESIRSYYSVTE